MPNEAITEAAFIKLYGDTEVQIRDSEMRVPLSALVQMEKMFCPADESKRQDPADRIAFLARQVGRPALLPKHQYLVSVD